MSKVAVTFDQVMEESGLAAKWEERGKAIGEEQRSLRMARNLLAGGFSVEQTARLTELDVEKVKALSVER